MRCQDFSKFIFGKFVSLLSSLLQDAIEADNCRCLHQTCCLRGSSSSHCVCGFLWHCHRQTRQAFGAESVRARQSRCAKDWQGQTSRWSSPIAILAVAWLLLSQPPSRSGATRLSHSSSLGPRLARPPATKRGPCNRQLAVGRFVTSF